MSGETEKQPSGWTVDTALAHMQRQLDDFRSQMDERYQRQNASIVTANTETEIRFASVNEFRQQQADIISLFLPRAEADVRFQALNQRLESLATSRDSAAGRLGGLDRGWAAVVAIAAVAAVVISLIVAFHHG